MSKRPAEEENVCSFFLEKKKRLCRMKTTLSSMKFCPHHSHLGNDHDNRKGPRIPCPFDPSHFCYQSKLQQHLKKCNAREKEKPDYYVPNVNIEETNPCINNNRINLCDVSDDDLLRFIKRIKILHSKNELPVYESRSNHYLVQAEIEKLTDGIASLKHLKQQAALLGIMEDFRLLASESCYVELGAGKGQLMYWIVKSTSEKKENCYVLIDRSSQRHKSDNKFKDTGVQMERIKIDIQHLYIGRIPKVKKNIENVVGVCKHLCGAATDLALRCLMETLNVEENGKQNTYKPSGLVMALCCHHRCSWPAYVGKEFMLLNGLTESDFNLMCSIASWATCGLRKHSNEKEKSENNIEAISETNKQLNRYLTLGLTHEQREEIGRKCKRLIDLGRLFYLENKGCKTRLVNYIDSAVSPENIALVGLCNK